MKITKRSEAAWRAALRCGQDLMYLLAIFAVILILEVFPILGGVNKATLLGAVPDEYAFLDWIIKLRDMILQGDIPSVLRFGTPCGYGYIYWLAMALLGLPVKDLSYENTVIFYRMVGLFFKAVSVYCLYKGISLRAGKGKGILALLFFFAIPAYWFYGKLISCEFIVMATVSAAFYYLIKDDFRFGKDYWYSIILFSVSFGIKISVVPLGIYIPIYLLYGEFHKENVIRTVKTVALVVLIYFLCNITIATQVGRKLFVDWVQINKGTTHFPTFENLKGFYLRTGISTWDRILNSGFKEEFLSIGQIIGACIVVAAGIYRGDRSRYLVVFGFSAAISILFVLSCMIGHHWYLFAPVMALIFFIFISDRRDRILEGLGVVLVAVVLICSYPRIEQRYVHRLNINQELEENWRESAVVERYLREHGTGGVILHDIFLGLDVEDLEGVAPVFGVSVILQLENGDEAVLEEYGYPEWLYLANELDLNGYEIVLQTNCGYLYQKVAS